jgi:TonB family protein
MISAPHPAYPYEARKAKRIGSGRFLVSFDFDGLVTEVRPLESSGSAILDEASIRASRRWRCKPGICKQVTVPITFTLEGVQL